MSQTRLEVEIMTVFLLQLSEHFNQPAEICVPVKLPKTPGCPGNYQQLFGRADMVHTRMWSMGGGDHNIFHIHKKFYKVMMKI